MIIKHVKPPVQDKLKAHYFDRYTNTFDGNKLLSSVGDQSEGREIQPGRCYDFDGVDDYVVTNNTIDIFDGDDFYAECYFMTRDAESGLNQALFGQHFLHGLTDPEAAPPRFGLVVNGSGKIVFQYGTGIDGKTPAALTSNVTVESNRFYHVKVELIGTDIKMYLDGEQVASTTASDIFIYNDHLFYIGRSPSSILHPHYFNGKIFGVKIYSYTKEKYLVFFKCDEGSGVNSYDSSGNDYRGTITNASLETFHSTQNIYSWQNEVGYSIGKSFSINPTDTVHSINDGGSTVYNIPDGGTYWFNTSDELDPDGEPVNVWTEAGLNIYRSSNTSGVTSATSQLFRLQQTVVSGRFIISADVHQGSLIRISYRYRGYYSNFRTQHTIMFGELPPESLTVEQFYYALSGDHPEHGEQYPETVLGLSGATSSQYRDVLFNAGIEDPVLFTDLLGTSNIFLESPTSTSWDYVLTPVVDFNPQINANNNRVIFNTDDLYATGQLGTGTTGYFSILQRSLPTISNFFLASAQPIWLKLKQFSFDSATIVPRNESDPSKDILGKNLEYKGQVAYNALLKQSNCLNLDGVDDYIEFDNATGWDRLENDGTSELTINGNNIEGTEGSVYNLRVYDSADNLIAHYPCSEGGGLKVYDVIGNNHGTLVNATLETVWDKQDEYHYNIKDGYSKGKGFSIKPSDEKEAENGGSSDSEFRYTSQEGINYHFTTGTFYNPSTGLYDPDGNSLGYTSEYFNFYKELAGNGYGGGLMAISSSFSANTVKIDCEVKSGVIHYLQGRDNTLQSRFFATLNDKYGFGNVNTFANQGEFYWAISGLDPTYGESFPETVGFPVGTTSQELRDLLVSIGIENIDYFIEDLFNTPAVLWFYCLQRVFSIPININNTYGRTEIELGIYDIKPNGGVSSGNMYNYYLQYNTNLERYGELQLRCSSNTWVHFYSVTVDETHTVPASQSNRNQSANGLKLENIAGRHHNGAETLIDFTGGVEDNPYAVERNLPTDYAFNQNYLFKDQSMKGVRESNFLVTDVDDGDDVMSVLNYLKRKDGTLLRLEGATSISFRVQTHSGTGYEIDWGDGTVTSTTNNQLLSHTYLTPYTGDIMLIVEPDDVSRIMCSNPGLAFDLIKLEPFVNLTYVNFSGSNSITGDVKYLADSITYLLIGGQNTVYGNVKDLPNSLTYIRVDGNNTLSGDIKDLPRSITELRVQGNTTIYGDVADIPRGVTILNTRNTPNIGGHASDLPPGLISINMSHSSIYGDLGDLPRTLDSLYLTGGISLSGDIADLPPSITNISDINASASAIIYGDIADLPNSLTAITIRHASNTITGDIGNLHEGLKSITIYGNNTITGNIADIKEGVSLFRVEGQNTVYGDLAELPSTMRNFVVIGNSSISDYSGKSWSGLTLNSLSSRPVTGGLSTAEVDQLLIDLMDVSTWSGDNPQVNLTRNNAPRSSASDAAVALLQSKGVTVATN